jgi:hypothetical protein
MTPRRNPSSAAWLNTYAAEAMGVDADLRCLESWGILSGSVQ